MKIVYLHQYFNTPDMSGGTRSYEMARRWVAAGHEVHIVTTSREGSADAKWSTTVAGGTWVHWRSIPYDNGMGFYARVVAFFRFVLVAGPKARSLNGDVVFASSTPLTIILPAIYATLFRTVPIVFEVRDLWPKLPIAVGRLRNPLMRSLAFGLQRLAYARAKRIVALSEDMAVDMRQLGVPDEKIAVAPNSCDIEDFDLPSSAGLAYRERNDWLGGRPFVVYCGTIGEMNDVEYLVRLAVCMITRAPAVAFGIYGTGSKEVEVRMAARKSGVLGVNLFMPGKVAKLEVPAILSAASVVTSVFLPIPEMRANSANKFFDGLAAAKPIVINYEGWQADLIRSTNAGIVLSATDVDLAADSLAIFLADGQRLAAASEASRRLACQRFSRDAIARNVLDTIEDAST